MRIQTAQNDLATLESNIDTTENTIENDIYVDSLQRYITFT